MRALLLLALLLAGCTTPGGVTQTDILVEGVRAGEIGFPASGSRVIDERVRVLAADPRAPPATLAGAPVAVASALARVTAPTPEGAIGERDPCGGALLLVPANATDPRRRALVYDASETVVDANGSSWLADRYHDPEGPVWVQNVGGGRGFFPDDGRDCPAPAWKGWAYNSLVHAEGVEALDVFLGLFARPDEPVPGDGNVTIVTTGEASPSPS